MHNAPFRLLVLDTVEPWYWSLDDGRDRERAPSSSGGGGGGGLLYRRDVTRFVRSAIDQHALVCVATKLPVYKLSLIL